MTARTLVGILMLAAYAGTAMADFQAVPEPGVLELVALGGVVAAIIGVRNRNRRK